MTPDRWFDNGRSVVWSGDCRDVLATMPDKSVDCTITDPPYSEHTHQMARTNRRTTTGVSGKAQRALSGGQSTFESITFNELVNVLEQVGRVTRRWVVATVDTRHAAQLVLNPDAIPGLRLIRQGVWAKTNPMPSVGGDRPGQGWEPIVFLHPTDERVTWNGGGRSSVWIHPVAQNTGHPTAKPFAMVCDWVRLFTNPGDTIFDPFAGSGTVLAAANFEGRYAIGCEADPQYLPLIGARLAHETLPTEWPDPNEPATVPVVETPGLF